MIGHATERALLIFVHLFTRNTPISLTLPAPAPSIEFVKGLGRKTLEAASDDWSMCLNIGHVHLNSNLFSLILVQTVWFSLWCAGYKKNTAWHLSCLYGHKHIYIYYWVRPVCWGCLHGWRIFSSSDLSKDVYICCSLGWQTASGSDPSTEDVYMGDRWPPVQSGLLRMFTWVTDDLQFRLVYWGCLHGWQMTSSSVWSTEDVYMGDRWPPVQTGLLRMFTWVTDDLQFRLVYWRCWHGWQMTSSSEWSTEDVDMGDRQPPVQTGLLRMFTGGTDDLQFRLVYWGCLHRWQMTSSSNWSTEDVYMGTDDLQVIPVEVQTCLDVCHCIGIDDRLPNSGGSDLSMLCIYMGDRWPPVQTSLLGMFIIQMTYSLVVRPVYWGCLHESVAAAAAAKDDRACTV